MSAFSLCPLCGDLTSWPDAVPVKVEKCFSCNQTVRLLATYDEPAARLLSRDIKAKTTKEVKKNVHKN